MNPKDPRHPWQRLVAGARRAREDRDDAAPYGFATRVAALALAAEGCGASVLERLAFRALGVACLLALASIAFNYSAPTRATAAEETVGTDDPMAVLLDV